MAGITRKMLKAMGIEDEQQDQIIEAHLSVVDSLKEERDNYRIDAEKAQRLQSRVDELETLAKSKDGENPYKAKYEKLQADQEKLQKEFNDYKAGIEHEHEVSAKKDAFRSLLKEIGISEKRIDTIIRATPEIDELVELSKDGDIRDKAKLSEKVKGEWSDFIVTSEDRKKTPENPPSNSGGRMTKEQIMEIKDTAARQKAIAENHDLFGY